MTLPLYILPLDSEHATLENSGGKGASLARLARAGHPVPGGFLITTAAYRAFTAANGLDGRILSDLEEYGPGAENDPARPLSTRLEQASAAIGAAFQAGQIPPALVEELGRAYREMGGGPVAVRSSATAEDLPELSFAGQQETYLNIQGEESLLGAVVRCWASLWTARAIGYRARQGISPEGLALAVVVQRMVPSEASGVLFTANPLSGLRSEIVIDATLGLGEALVSGQVEPDHYVVDGQSWTISQKILGAKALSIRSRAGGGTDTLSEDASQRQALADEQILALARLGKQVEAEAGLPQDIEWGWAEGRLSLLQSRPITSLFPPPPGATPGELRVYFSFGAVQGMLDPITPLGRETLFWLFASGSAILNYQRTVETQGVLRPAGERLWVDVTAVMRNSVGRKAARAAMPLVEPGTHQALLQIWDEPRLQPGRKGISFGALGHLFHLARRLVPNILLNLANPERRRAKITGNGERILAEARRSLEQVRGSQPEKLLQRMGVIERALTKELPGAFPLYISGIAAGMAPFNLLNNLAESLPAEPGAAAHRGWHPLALEVTRGMPFNPTTQMDLDLWQTAQTIRGDRASLQLFQASPPAELSARYLEGGLPPAAQAAVNRFLGRYGLRGLAEIDLGRPRWQEDPTHVFQVLGSYIQIEDQNLAPDAVFTRGAESAARAVETLAARLRRTRFGRLRTWQARAAARRVRGLMGMREEPKFFAVRLLGLVRLALLESGSDYVQSGELERRDDVVFLTWADLKALAAGESRNWKALVAARRQAYSRELMRRQIPRLLLSDGRAFYEGMESPPGDKAGLTGSPVSPGVAEGAVRVILDPRGAQILPGEILVCPGTDPSWTPLFLAAGGLIMEVGGMMTHGAVVAREYGIPAAVGVHQATTRLQTGQRIRLDGSTGAITLL